MTLPLSRLFSFFFLVAFLVACEDNMDMVPDESTFPTNVWNGTPITFAKTGDTDPADALNQDRITDSVWITRGERGQIFNIVREQSADKDISPIGTAWANGRLPDWQELSYTPFRTAVPSPKDAVGDTLVVHLLADDVYLELVFQEWSSGGSFSYSRTTAGQ